MKILVTGGAGFVGSNLCEKLAKDSDNEVISLDNYFTGSADNHIAGVEYVFGDTMDISNIFGTQQFDLIYHLGEYSRVEQSFDAFDLIHNYNIIGTKAVLDFVKTSGAKLIYSGSSTKFADETEGYIMSPYAWTKKVNTELVIKYGEWYGIDYAISYFYNVYGPREIRKGKYATLIAMFGEKIKNGENLTVVSPGTQIRNFTHVSDIVSALILIGEHGHGDGYGIGHSHGYTIFQVAQMFGGEVEMLPERKGNRMSAPVVTTRTKDLGWFPKLSLPEYIAKEIK